MDFTIIVTNILMLLTVTYITVVATKYTDKDTAGLPLLVMLVLDAALTYVFYNVAVDLVDVSVLKRSMSVSFMIATFIRVLFFVKQLKTII